MIYHCQPCQTEWVSDSPRCWSCRRVGERGQLITRLRNTNDPYTTPRWTFSQADADALVRGDN